MTDLRTEFYTLSDFEKPARENMSAMAWEYLASGAADELTLGWNSEAFNKIKLNPRVLADVSALDTTVELFGQKLPFPILLAPVGMQRLYHPDGEIAAVRGAGKSEAVYVVSSYANTSVEDIAAAATTPIWFQLYLQPDRTITKELVQRAVRAGCRALCVTADLPVIGMRNRMERARFEVPSHLEVPHMMENFTGSPATWDDVDWLLSFADVPVVLKGILNPVDAEIAVKHGVAGIIVSNHGARDLDSTPATIDALPAVVDAVAGRMPVLMDGGIRRGTDVLKAMAYGANAVLIGRPFAFGLGAAGSAGVARVVEILRTEFEKAMALCGRSTIASIDRSVIWK